MLLPILLASTPLIGYLVASQAAEELSEGKKWFFTGSLLVSATLFWLVPWWLAAAVILGLVIGWFAGLFALLLIILAPADWTLACVIAVLGVVLGTRWRTEKRSLKQLIMGSLVIAALGIILPQFI